MIAATAAAGKLPRVSSAPSDTASLDAFLASVERRAFRIAQVATDGRDDALDLVQDAMLQLARRYAARPPEEWPALFYRILQNRIRDWQRHQTVRGRLFFWRRDSAADAEDEVEDPVQLLPDPAGGGAELLQRAETMQHLERALRLLPARQREAFELRIWEGLSVEEAATAMGCTGGSVKTHLHRALGTLREQLEGVWP
jgi:RNA polymerase sigma-70 factor (ECF subfamily)